VTTDEVREMLRKACDRAGTARAWADQAGVSGAYVSDVLNGRREPGEAICKALGIERETVYRKAAR
jgi:DNA-binding transcriptional regulator YdaS (Cro superfamily)